MLVSTGRWRHLVSHTLCAFVRSRVALLTAEPQPRHQKVKAQLLRGHVCSISHGAVPRGAWGGTVLLNPVTRYGPPQVLAWLLGAHPY